MSRPSENDAALILMGEKFDAWEKRYQRSYRHWQGLWKKHAARMGDHKFWKKLEEEAEVPHPDDLMCEPEACAIMRAIMAVPATTIAGVAIKAKLVALFMDKIWEQSYEDADWDDLIVRSLVDAIFRANDIATKALASAESEVRS